MIIAIVGPTGIGKTALSIALAKHYQAEVINFDSIQVYEKLDIGSAKVTKDEMNGVKHHLLSFVPLYQNYSVYDYQQAGRNIVNQLLSEKKNIVLVGGTGLYLKALLYDYRFEKQEEYLDYENLSNQEIVEKIRSFGYDGIFDESNRRRLVRILAKLETGKDISTCGDKKVYDFRIVGLSMDRDKLYQRLDERVDKMFDAGLVEEILSIKNYFSTSKALQTGIGYKEFIPYLEGKCTLEEVKNTIKKNSRHYAKRQFTFFKHQFDTKWYTVDIKNFSKTVENVIRDLEMSEIE